MGGKRPSCFVLSSFPKFTSYRQRFARLWLGTSFEAYSHPGLSQFQVAAVQIFDNLVGCSKEEFVSTLSQPGRFYKLTRYNESLIPAQNQRWRRA